MKPLQVLSRLISIIVHPLMMPVYCTIYTLYGSTLYSYLPSEIKSRILLNVGCYACLSPLLVLGIFIVLDKVTDMEMPLRKERPLPLLIMSVVTSLGTYMTNSSIAWAPINHMIIGETTLLLVAGIISIFWKISLHTIGAGGLLSYVCLFGTFMRDDYIYAAGWAFLMAGLAAWARLYIGVHTPAQLIVGYVVGVLTMFGTIYTMTFL